MSRRSPPLFVLVFAATFTACGEPGRPAPVAPHASVIAALTPTCDIPTLRIHARAYAASYKDPLFTIIDALQKLSKYGPNAAATDKGFDGLARLAAMRGTSAQSSSATGTAFDGLTRGFLGCMESHITSTVPGDFTVAGALGSGWLYEVRGNDNVDGAAGAYERGGASPYWAAEAPAGWGASISATSPAKRFLIYGSRTTDFHLNDPTVGIAFELRTIPTISSGTLTLSSPLLIGLCDVDVNPTLRVQHVSDILRIQSLTCGAPPSFTASATLSSRVLGALAPTSLARQVIDLVSPRPLHASFAVGSVGGGASELSPSAVIDMQGVTLRFARPIAGGIISQPLADGEGNPIQVRVTTLSGTPLPGAVVTLAIALNRSSIAFFKDGTAQPSASVTRATGSDGVAMFDNVFLTKAGGYDLVVSGSFDGVAAAPVTSNSFNMKNK